MAIISRSRHRAARTSRSEVNEVKTGEKRAKRDLDQETSFGEGGRKVNRNTFEANSSGAGHEGKELPVKAKTLDL